jgi:hypothetical protein
MALEIGVTLWAPLRSSCFQVLISQDAKRGVCGKIGGLFFQGRIAAKPDLGL